MAEYNINNPGDLIECPYEKAHMIRACRMQYHLIKCRKQHDATEFVTCPFNARHEVYRVEARYHQATCPDRTRIVHMLAHSNEDSDTALKGCTDLPTYKPRPHHHGGESWEDDIPSNPRVGVDTNLLERRQHYEEPCRRQAPNTLGLTASERRELYLKQLKAATKGDMNGQGSQFSLNSQGLADPGASRGSDVESEEDGQFVDTPEWVGGGYSSYSPFKEGGFSGGFRSAFDVGDAPGAYPGFATPQTSSSGTSSVIPSGSEASMASSTEEAQRSLKRVRKMLRQIDKLEKKRQQGIKLNADEESKVSRKWALTTEEEELQTQLEVLSVD